MEQRNLILAIVASIAILLGFELLYNEPLREQQAREQAQQAEQQADGGTTAPTPGGGQVPGGAPGAANAPERASMIENSPRVRIETPTLSGSISLVGGRIDDLTLINYNRTLDPDSPKIDLLSPRGSRQAYFADFGWSAVAGDAELPGPDTRWQAEGGPLAPGNPVTLSWTSGAGLTFERVFRIDEDYMFTVTQRVTNAGESAVSLAPYGLISRRGTPDTLGYYILHEGPIGVFNGTLDEVDYDDVRDDGPLSYETTGGWIGITDKYWLVSLVPDQDSDVQARFVHQGAGGIDKYQSDVLYDTLRVAPGGSVENTTRLFAGAKEVTLLDGYAEQYGIPNFDKAVDFGWFYFLTKPIFQALHYFAEVTGNFGVAILILVVILKILLFPLANKSYRSMAKMRKLQPEMVKLRERFGDDKQRLNQEMMALYKKEGANPASGCLPILLQIPIFFALYKVLFVTLEMRHAPFVGYLQDLSAKDPTTILNLFGLLPWGVPELGPLDVLNIGFLPLIMGISMYGQQMLNPQPADPMQARIFKFLPVIFTFILSQFPAGLVLYWTSNNIFTIAQQYIIMKRAGMQIGGKQEAPAAAAAASGGGESGGKSGNKPGKQKGQRAAAADSNTIEATAEEVSEPAEGEVSAPDGEAAASEPSSKGQTSKSRSGGGQTAQTGKSQSSGGGRQKGSRGSSNPAAKGAKGSRSKSGGKKGGGKRR